MSDFILLIIFLVLILALTLVEWTRPGGKS